jgi:uncharacterized protein YcaQ
LPTGTLGQLLSHLGIGAPQWRAERGGTLQRAKARLAQARVEGVDWYWPAGENPRSRRHVVPDRVHLLAPFDPVVWDRRRFEHFWGWAYRFEAYTPAPKRQLGYYALPLLWRDQVIGWANASVKGGLLLVDCGYIDGRAPRDPDFRRALAEECERLAQFLGVQAQSARR